MGDGPGWAGGAPGCSLPVSAALLAGSLRGSLLAGAEQGHGGAAGSPELARLLDKAGLYRCPQPGAAVG